MKVGFIASSLSRKSGGLFFSVRSLSQAFSRIDSSEAEVFGLEDAFSDEDRPQWLPLEPKTFPVIGPRAVSFSPSLTKAVIRSDCDLLHTQHIWEGPSISVHHWYRRTSRPYLVSPRGMLDPWALKNARWKKRIAALLYEDRHLRDAACLHALCRSEAESISAYGLKGAICVIPNGVDLPESQVAPSKAIEVKTLLFLGRLHPKKGLINAIRAWNSGRNRQASQSWRLVIAGWDQGGHEAELKTLATELGIKWADAREQLHASSSPEFLLLFVGPVFGHDKDVLLRQADAFILPSFSEGLPMAVLEAWAYELPVVMTDHCNLPEGFLADAAVRIGTDQASIETGLSYLFSAPSSTLVAMGQAGRHLVEKRFTWTQIAAEMKTVYEWVLGGGSKPDTLFRGESF